MMKYICRMMWVLMMLILTVGVTLAQDDTADTPFIGLRYAEAQDGVLVTGIIDNTPAIDLDVEAGDILTAVNSEPVDAYSIKDIVWTYAIGDTITLTLEHDGVPYQQEITLVTRPADLFTNPRYAVPADLSTLGITTSTHSGNVTVLDIVDGSPAQDANLQIGDVIKRVDGEAVNTIGQAAVAMSDLNAGDEVALHIKRDNRYIIIRIIIRDDRKHPRQLDVNTTYETEDVRIGYDDDMIQILDLSTSHTLYHAGLRTHDIITQINGDTISNQRDLFSDDRISLTIDRSGDIQIIDVPTTVAPLLMFGMDAPHTQNTNERLGLHEKQVMLGVRYIQLDPANPSIDGLTVANGAYIFEAIEGLPAEQASIQAGDIIVAVDGIETTLDVDLRSLMYTYQAGQTVTLDVVRDNETLQFNVTLRVATR